MRTRPTQSLPYSPMTKGRLEAFSDGVIAIIITIMVLELRVPATPDLHGLQELTHEFALYVLSFAFLGTYWNNHHHMLHAASRVTGGVLWANLHLLFWLSLVPFATRWMGESNFAETPTATYGFVLTMSGIAYSVLQGRIIHAHGSESQLARAVGRDWKGKLSMALYAPAVPLAYVNPWISITLFVAVTLMWLVPDRRIELELGR